MLTISDFDSHLGRRDFLRIGSLGLGGLALPALLSAGESSSSTLHDRSVIFLFLHGGPSQIETFDPKPEAAKEYRSATGEVKTTLPGVTFGGSFPKLAKLAEQVSIVRSFVTGDGNHDIKPVVGKDSAGANLGSVLAHVNGPSHPTTGMPRNIALFPRAVDTRAQKEQTGFGRFDSAGPFGSACAPFAPGAGGKLQKDMTLRLSQSRLADRRALLAAFDRAKVGIEAETASLDAARQKAFQVLLRGVGDAFDLSKENRRTVEKYDTEPLVAADSISKKWNNHKFYLDNARTLGKLLLLARRLCERGAGFVTVTTNFVWDMHADVNNATMVEGMKYMGTPLDHALSAFLEDVRQRGLSKKILLVVTGEMGRTPRINAKGGRDHWGGLAPLLLAGGGLKMGQVIGKSDRTGGRPATTPMKIQNLIATIVNSLFDTGKLRLVRGLPREIGEMIGWEPIAGLEA